MQSYDIVNLLCSKLGTWVRRMRALKLDEERLKASMPPGRAGILSSKRLLLVREIIWDESALPRKMVPASISIEELCSRTEKSNTALQLF